MFYFCQINHSKRQCLKGRKKVLLPSLQAALFCQLKTKISGIPTTPPFCPNYIQPIPKIKTSAILDFPSLEENSFKPLTLLLALLAISLPIRPKEESSRAILGLDGREMGLLV